MALFGRKAKSQPASPTPVRSAAPPHRAAAQPTTDFSDVALVRKEWAGQLESRDDGMLGWRNGMRMYNEGPIPQQRLNVAEYMTRALAYNLVGPPLLDDDDAVETVRRVLVCVDSIPAEPAWMRDSSGRLARLALTICRERGWQATSLGGDGKVTKEIVDAEHSGPVWDSIQAPGVARADAMRHFFQVDR